MQLWRWRLLDRAVNNGCCILGRRSDECSCGENQKGSYPACRADVLVKEDLAEAYGQHVTYGCHGQHKAEISHAEQRHSSEKRSHKHDYARNDVWIQDGPQITGGIKREVLGHMPGAPGERQIPECTKRDEPEEYEIGTQVVSFIIKVQAECNPVSLKPRLDRGGNFRASPPV